MPDSAAPPPGVAQDREYFAPIELGPRVKMFLEPIAYGPSKGKNDLAGRVYRVGPWKTWPMFRRIAFLRAFVEDTARDPAIARKAVTILRDARVDPKDHRAAWAAFLSWVQTNIYYVNEPEERLQSPQYTLTERHGDCDDLAILLAALGESLRLPWRYTISGRSAGKVTVWVEGVGDVPSKVDWSHIYLQVGGPPFKPTWWTFAEPTLKVPLGWSVLSRTSAPGSGRADLSGLLTPTPSTAPTSAPAGAPATPSSSPGSTFWRNVGVGALTTALSYTLAHALIGGVKGKSR